MTGVRRPPRTPAELGRESWWGVLRRTVGEFRRDNLSDWAAALTYYGVLSIFPALLALVSILGLFGKSTTQPLIDNMTAFAPGPVRELLSDFLRNTQDHRGGAVLALIGGVAVALWSASGYVAGFMRAANLAYDVGEWRPAWKTVPLRVAITAALVLLLAASATVVVFTGSLATKAGDVLGVGHTAVVAWNYAKWPVLILVVALIFALLYWAAPNVRQPGLRWILPGSLLAVLVWIAASALFAVYIANFASYNKTYGSLAAVIIFLVWLWLTNAAILLGVEFNAELQRGRAISAGQPPQAEPYVEPRDTRKRDQE